MKIFIKKYAAYKKVHVEIENARFDLGFLDVDECRAFAKVLKEAIEDLDVPNTETAGGETE
jgi:hypothetical protein